MRNSKRFVQCGIAVRKNAAKNAAQHQARLQKLSAIAFDLASGNSKKSLNNDLDLSSKVWR
jgi:hypothetical protein